MPRSRPTRSAGPTTQRRQAHTVPTRSTPPPAPAPAPASAPMSHSQPTLAQHAPPQRQPGLFAQMASTAAGVAVGSAVGHTMANGISSMFGGSAQPADQIQEQPQQAYQQQNTMTANNSCEADAKAFTKCLEQSNNDISACQFYLEALKSCQQMAAKY
ncbi:Coiled-coil-helix-coiled-coil-helix domain-containing protein 2 [Apophysomyces ossiformis]|uniref:Coiled-coil-helix-coiled-coil-helix domain-containing protein 2 n=1 Tax=Apophysomyces ossiformis TaxID=679940 RepID=A0A8H7EUV5_9FUNG|nr:Coiled-coil-helix-coiled-coil-helix domain-containing protein 2 [Apophysomyces ossiformis]